jgi:aminocarboxymuconate-semialdehyde decarboxylase
MEDSPTVDIHTHILPEHIPDFSKEFGYGEFITLDHYKPQYAKMMKGKEFFREVFCNCFEVNQRLTEMSETNVNVQVLSTVPVMFSYWAKPVDGMNVAKFLNDDIATKIQTNEDKFIGLGTLPLQDPELSVEELDRCINELNLTGIQIGSNINGLNLSEKALFPVYKRAEELGAAIFVHPWDMMGFDRLKKYWLPWLVSMPAETSAAICSLIFGGVFEKFPKLRFAFAHGGGSFLATIGRIEHGFKVRPDLVAVDNKRNPTEYLGHFWIDSILHDQSALDYSIEKVGIDKIALGTDYPFPLGELEPGKLIVESKYSETDKQKMLGLNAFDWLGISSSKY